MKGLTAKLKALAVNESITVRDTDRANIHMIGRRVKIRVSVRREGSKFVVTKVGDYENKSVTESELA